MDRTCANPPVPLWRLFLKMGGWWVIGLTVILVVLSFASFGNAVMADRFETEGRAATATVTERYLRESTDSDGDRTVTYYLTFAYTTQKGEAIELNRSVPRAVYYDVEQGGRWDLQYLESDPRKVELRDGDFARGASSLRWIALVVGLVWLGLLWWIGRRAVAALRARMYGRREEAEVLRVERSGVKVNNRYRYRLVWRDGDGTEGRSLLRREADLAPHPVGSRVVIFHGLARTWWAGDVGDRPGR